MSEEELQLFITLDDPVDIPEEDTFNHLRANNFNYWLGQRSPAWCRIDQPPETVSDSDSHEARTPGGGEE